MEKGRDEKGWLGEGKGRKVKVLTFLENVGIAEQGAYCVYNP